MTISPAGQHVGWAGFQGSRSVAVVDGHAAATAYDTLLPAPNEAIRFSDDGSHYAYIGRSGSRVDMVVDGKVIGRLPFDENVHAPYADGNANAPNTGIMFGPHGRHVYLIGAFDPTGQGGDRVVIDGTPGPTQSDAVAFSPDGRHYAYTVVDRPHNATYVVLDGKRQPPTRASYQFGADGSIVSVKSTARGQALVVDGRTLVTAGQIGKVYTSVGRKIVTSIGTSLWADGRTVAAHCDLADVIFSADGKHYAAQCGTNGDEFVVVDGKRGRDYFDVSNIEFTADGSHVIYEATVRRGGTNLAEFIVVDDKEFGPYETGGVFIGSSLRGSGYAFVAQVYLNGYPKTVLIWNGREVPLNGLYVTNAAPQPVGDGSHLICVAHPKDPTKPVLLRDGKVVQGLPGYITPLGAHQNTLFVASPDGTHLAYVTSRNNPRGPNYLQVHMDDRMLYDGTNGPQTIVKAVFTPDSRHLFWVRAGDARSHSILYVDDKPVLQLPDNDPFFHQLAPSGGDQYNVAGAWQMNPDGSLQFLTVENGQVVRYHITIGG